jgi:STAM-binding protein
MRVPSQLITQFLSLAQRNTSNRIETLGLLLGTERMQYGRIPQLVVEVLLIPNQTGTSDTCAMLSEEQVLQVSLERGLDCLGWVSGVCKRPE